MSKRILLPIWLVIMCMFTVSSNASELKKGAVGLTDGLGREMMKVSSRQNKYVGMFYHLLCEENGKPNNATEIFREYDDALTNPDRWSKRQEGYYWGQSVYGYYNMRYDEYVLRRHAQLLTKAGVDTIIIDYSNACVNGVENGLTDYYKHIIDKLVETYLKMRAEGSATPQITFLLTWSDNGAAAAFKHLYDDYYSKPEYEDLWFKWKEGILVIGSPNQVPDDRKAGFTFRTSWPYYASPEIPEAWPWMSVYPQECAYTADDPREAVAVSVAQNWNDTLNKKQFCYFSDCDENGNFIAQGRSFTDGNKKLLKDPISSEYKSEEGANYAQQWERALSLDPDFVFVTGWNESCVARFVGDDFPVIGKFCDQFTTEFSRDIEPSLEGALSDNFYCQTCEYIRKYKGAEEYTYDESCKKTVSIDGNFSEWDSVDLVYGDDEGDQAVRNCKGYGSLKYENNTGRNDIAESKVAYDDKNIYFYVRTKDNISSYSDTNWMNLFIGVTDEDGHIRKDIANWQGFSYVLNRENVGDGVTRLERSKGGYTWEVANDFINYKVSGKSLEVCIPLSALGIKEGSIPNIVFKWADNTASDGDILKFYTDGDASPEGRSYFVFGAPAKKTDKIKNRTLIIATLCALAVLIGGMIFTIKRKKKSR